MPIFEYICSHCNHRFETLVLGSRQPCCPKCESKDLAPQLSVFSVSAKSSPASASPSGGCGTCGDPRGPGACSLDWRCYLAMGGTAEAVPFQNLFLKHALASLSTIATLW